MRYVELHCHSAYSFLDGASRPEELAAAAAAHGYPALALTDHDGVWGAMEFAQACRALGVRPITGAELTRRPTSRDRDRFTSPAGREPRPASGTSAGCSPRRTRARARSPARAPPPRRCRWTSLERHAEGLVCLSGCARDGALAGAFERAGDRRGADARRRGAGRRLAAPSGRERFRVELQRPFWRHDRARNRWLERPGRAARRAVRGDRRTSTRTTPRGRALQDALVAVRLRATLDQTEPRAARQRSSAIWPRRPRWRRASRDHPDAVAETARLAERLEFDLTRDLGYRYPGLGGPGRRPRSWPSSAGRGSSTATRARREQREARRRLEEELRVIRTLRAVGLLPAPPRHARAGARGRGRGARAGLGAGAAAARARARLERQLDRLLPDRALAHRPDPQRALPGPLPERGDHRGARHRPRLPARHPREADPARPRALRRTSARRWSRRSRPTARAARSATSARRSGLPAGEIERVARSVDVYDRPDVGRARTWTRRSARSGPARRAGGRWSSWRARPTGCRATPPSTPAGW